MSYHLGLLLRPASQTNKLYKSISFKDQNEDSPIDHFIVPISNRKVKIFNILHGSFYNRETEEGDTELIDYVILDGEPIVDSANNIKANVSNTSPAATNHKTKSKIKRSIKQYIHKMFVASREEQAVASQNRVPEIALPFAATFNHSKIKFEITVKGVFEDGTEKTALNKYKLIESDDDLVLIVTNGKPESVDIQFFIEDEGYPYQKSIRLHLAKSNKIDDYCLDFGSDAIQVSRFSDEKTNRINLYKEFNAFAKSSFSTLFSQVEKHNDIYSKTNYFEKKNIYQRNTEEVLYDNLVFVSKELEDVTNREETLKEERCRKPTLKDYVQFFNSVGLTPNHSDVGDIRYSNSRKASRIDEVKDLLINSEKEFFKNALNSHFLDNAKTLQKNLKLTFLNGIVDNDYIPIYTTCISRIIWVLLEDMKVNKKEHIDFTILYPNSFNSGILNKMKNILNETFENLLENHSKSNLKGFEIHFISESDAAFLGIIGRDRNSSLMTKEKPYALMIDIGKGTMDISLLKKESTNNRIVQDQFFTITRKGSLKAGNFLTAHIFLDILCYGYRNHPKAARERHILSHLKAFNQETLGSNEIGIIELIEKIKTSTNEKKINTSDSIISKVDEGGGTNDKLFIFLTTVNTAGYAFDPKGQFYKHALNEIANKLGSDLDEIFDKLDFESDDISLAFLSGRSFMDSNLRRLIEKKLDDYGLDEDDVKTYENKIHAVSIFNEQRGSLNFNNSIYKNVVFTPKNKELSIASIADLISCGVDCDHQYICLDNNMDPSPDHKINMVGSSFYKSHLENRIYEQMDNPNIADLCYAGFPFWTNEAYRYNIDFNRCNYTLAPPLEEVKHEESTPVTKNEIEPIILPIPSTSDLHKKGLDKAKELEDNFLNED